MNLQIQSRHLRVSQKLQSLIQRQSAKVRKLLPTFSESDLDLHVHLERHSTSKQFHATLVLTLPQRAIRVEDIESDISTAVHRAFAELVRRVKKFKSHWAGARHRRETLRRGEIAVAPPVAPDEAVPSESWERVENYVRREIFHRAILQGIPPGLIQTHALMDEIFVDISGKAPKRPGDLTVEQWMFHIAREKIRTKVEELRSSNEPHLEEVSNSGQDHSESMNFYQPDEVLRLEDLLKDPQISTPEEYLERDETESAIQAAIANLDPNLRESFVLFVLEGFNSQEAAMLLGKDPTDVLDDVKSARALLRAQLEG